MTPEEPVFGPPAGRDLHLSRRYSRWAVWGCLTLVLAGALMFGAVFVMMLKDPKVWRAAENLARCQERMQVVSGALDRYNEDKGHLPVRLEDLYPTYLADRANLRCPSDPVPGTNCSFVFRKGVAWGQGRAVVVYCPHHPARDLMPGKTATGAAAEAGNVVPIIHQNGQVDREIRPLEAFRQPADTSTRKR